MKQFLLQAQILCAIVICFFPMTVMAQEQPADVFVAEDNDLGVLLGKAEKLVADNNYIDAMKAIDSIKKSIKANNICRKDNEDSNLFWGIEEQCNILIRKIPPESLGQFIKEQEMKGDNFLTQYKRDKNTKHLTNLLRECYLSAAVNEAACLLADTYLENNNTGAARRILNQIPYYYANKHTLRSLSLLAMCNVLAKENDEALKNAKMISENFRGQKTIFMGKEYEAEALAAEITKACQENNLLPKKEQNVLSTDKLPCSVDVNMKWKAVLPGLNLDFAGVKQPTPIKGFPTVWDNVVYINTGAAIKRFDLPTGNPIGVDLFLKKDVQVQSLTYPISSRMCTVVDGIVFANLITGNNTYSIGKNQTYPIIKADMAAFDAKTGDLMWAAQDANKEDKDFVKLLMWSIIVSPPTVLDNIVFLDLATMTELPENSLVALDAKTGKLLWKTLICSKKNVVRIKGMMSTRMTTFPLLIGSKNMLLDNDNLIFENGYGAMGSLNATNGHVNWLRCFQPLQKEMRKSESVMGKKLGGEKTKIKEDPGWKVNPSIKIDDKSLVFAPPRSSNLYCLDYVSGKSNKKILDTSTTVRQVLGYIDGRLYLYDDKFIETTLKSDAENIVWGQFGPVAGQGVICKNLIIMPFENKIVFFARDKRKIVNIVDVKEGADMGNLTLYNDYLLMMSKESIVVFNIQPNNKKFEEVVNPSYKPDPQLSKQQNYFGRLIRDLGDLDCKVQTAAYSNLVRCSPNSFEMLLKEKNNANMEISLRVNTILSSLKWMTQDQIEEIFNKNLPLTGSKNFMKRDGAAAALLDLGVNAVPYCIKNMSSTNQNNPALRANAAMLVSLINPKSPLAIPHLIELSKKDPEKFVREAAVKALFNITNQKFADFTPEQLETWSKENKKLWTMEEDTP